MSYEHPPVRTGLPREVVKWLHGLHLSLYPRNVRSPDRKNNYRLHNRNIEALQSCQHCKLYKVDSPGDPFIRQRNITFCQTEELEPDREGERRETSPNIMSPEQMALCSVQLACASNASEKSLQKQNLRLMKEVIDGTVHCKPGAAELLVQEVYTVLTNRSIRNVQGPESDFTDREYQEFLPTVARSTASKAIKNNLTMTEIMAEPDISTNQRKAEAILHRHLQHRAAERVLYPGRFKVKPNPGQLAATNLVSSSRGDECSDSPSSADTASKSCSSSTRRRAAVSYKEIKVQQPVRRSLVKY